ncbi:hypothetical protein HGH92_16235 [Chitinophaga varians]|uniref:Uncharacterized protein n=1 Tax=Chitinophaga varians TaxID=2202339 RepID=A0A847RS17_9BACT|nr:hypothetical protein [Chitinophaga varians]NLR65863.1 hypothetical protein [Chitinophaga varians]
MALRAPHKRSQATKEYRPRCKGTLSYQVPLQEQYTYVLGKGLPVFSNSQ